MKREQKRTQSSYPAPSIKARAAGGKVKKQDNLNACSLSLPPHPIGTLATLSHTSLGGPPSRPAGKRSQHRAIHRSVRVACQPHLASPMEYLSTVQHFSPLSPAPLAWVMGGTSCTKLTEMDYSALPVEEL
ncbi:hypothetical protein Pcinc_018696 [Petrolisthes cinctipes]|uniref:Uncharacterized protein n=1 Tax=Petrolisthes cinctipes TaxID=88211 RepID=A0AAE1FLM5_PETCI|nr:hypothetical protein Pcinc_018696 [Petrolisthes cinctipes]